IEYLPPYSPNYNPIKQTFSIIKAHLHHSSLGLFAPKRLYYEMYCACDCIGLEMT
ncbi:hypothetical protein PAXRUDRAFT_148335, partial [Paxillus rubicundulus Ve08.2h10]